jgi:hypothetical protein
MRKHPILFADPPANTGQRENLHLVRLFYQNQIR